MNGEDVSGLGLLRDHLGLALSLGVFTVVSVKVLVAAHGGLFTALSILRESGTVNVTVAILLEALPLALAIGTVLFVYTFRWSSATEGWYPSLTAAMALVALCVLLVPAREFVVGVAVTLIAVGARWARLKTQGSDSESVAREQTLRSTIIVIFMVFGSRLLADSLWMPAEKVSTGAEVTVGYVLDAGGEWTSILTERERRVEYLKTTEITARELCLLDQPSLTWSRPIASIIQSRDREPRYPVCGP